MNARPQLPSTDSRPADEPATPGQQPDVAGNAGFAMAARTAYLATRLVLPPLVLGHIPLADYGLWSACFVLVMYIGLTDVGFSSVYVRFVARFHAQGDLESINRLVSTGVLTLSAIGLLVLGGLWLALPLLLDFLKVAADQREKATILLLGAAAMFLLDLSLGAWCYILHGLQRIREEQKVAIVGFVLEPLLIVVFLNCGIGVYSLLAAFVLRYTWSLSAFARLAHRLLPGLQIRPAHFDRAMLRHFFGFGARVQASALLGTAMFSLDRLLAGFVLGPKGIALFELGAKLPNAAVSVPSAISNVAMPAAARHSAVDDWPAIVALYRATSRATCLLAGLPLAFMTVFAGPLCLAWLGRREDLEALPLILALGALSAHLHITTGPGSAIFRALGRVGNEFVYHGLRIAALSLAIGTAIACFGATATALAAGLAGGSASAAIAYLVHNQRRLGLGARRLLVDILLPGVAAYLVALAIVPVWPALIPGDASRLQTLGGVAVCGLLYSIAWAGVTWLQLEDAERRHVRTLVARLPVLRQWRWT